MSPKSTMPHDTSAGQSQQQWNSGVVIATRHERALPQTVTFLFIRLNEIPGSEPDDAAGQHELHGYQRVIEEVGGEFQGITRMIGNDAALLLFASCRENAPARQGVHAAVALRRRLEALNRERLKAQQIPFRIGIGVHSNTLSPAEEKERLVALHQCIQEAEGLSLLNRQAPFPAIFVSKGTVQGLEDSNGYYIQNLGEAFAPNYAKVLTVYAVMNEHGAN